MVSFGIKTSLQHTMFEDVLAVWQEADQIPLIEHAWLNDHFAPPDADISGPFIEGWATLAAMAALTNRLRMGVMVTGNTYRHPAVLAKIAATVDVISKGRLDFGLGAGWNEYEHESMGIPLYKPGERIRRFGEACEVIRRLFTEPKVDFAGQYYQLTGARSEPKPVQKPWPPFVLGGSGEKLTLRVVATYADMWNVEGGTVDQFRHKLSVLHEHCAAIGRDPAEIRLSYQHLIDADNYATSIPEVRAFVEAGISHVILRIPGPHGPGQSTRVAEEIIAKIDA